MEKISRNAVLARHARFNAGRTDYPRPSFFRSAVILGAVYLIFALLGSRVGAVLGAWIAGGF